MNNDGTSTRGTSSVVEHLESIRTRRNRRRKVVFGAFLVMSLAMGSMWALGLASVNVDAGGADGGAAAILGAPGTASTEKYAGAVTNPEGAINVAWKGLWGAVPDATGTNDETVFKVDLTNSSTTPAGTYYLDIYNTLSNSDIAAANRWSAAQLEFRLFKVTAADSALDDVCDTSTEFGANDAAAVDSTEDTASFAETDGTTGYTGNEREVIAIDSDDAYVSFPGLASGSVYCIGVTADSVASNSFGVFLRRAATSGSGSTPANLKFTAILNRSL